MNSSVGVGSVLRILAGQHACTRALLRRVAGGTGPDRRAAFDALRRLLAVHEASEGFVVRPAAQSVLPRPVVKALIEEERRLGEMIEHLELLDLDGQAFQEGFFAFCEALEAHMCFKEAEEWLPLEIRWTDEEQVQLGAWLHRAFAPDPASPSRVVMSDLATLTQSVALLFADDRARVEYRALFQEAVDRLAESRSRDEPSQYFEAVPVGAVA